MNRNLIRIIATSLLLIGAYIVQKTCDLAMWQLLLVYLVPYILVSYDVLQEASEGLMEGELFDENFLMCIATIGAFAIGFFPNSEPQFAEAVFVMLFFQIGELFEDYAEDKSRDSISHLMNIKPDKACVVRNGEEIIVAPEDVNIGEVVVVRPGEKIPIDGVVIEGFSSMNTMALTGESLPRDITSGDDVLSGCVNLSGVIKYSATKSYENSTVARILELVENTNDKKSRSEKFITRFARVYTPIVVILALLFAFLPPLFAPSYVAALPIWLERALTFLVVSCPCALVISVPLAFFSGIGSASRNGILIKGGNYMDALAQAGCAVFDKTGTLTEGRFEVSVVHTMNFDERELLHLAAHVEHYSNHPIAAALKMAYPEHESDSCSVTDVVEYAGKGIMATVEGKRVAVGNEALMQSIGLNVPICKHEGTIIHVAVDGIYAGHIVVEDIIKSSSAKTINELKKLGIRKTVMLTGDSEQVAKNVAKELKIDEYHSQLMPQDKVEYLERYIKQDSGAVIFVGDGINDAPVLALADVGIAMGALGSDAAIEAADVVLMDDNPDKIVDSVSISRRTVRIARQNVIFAIAIKIAVLILAALGLAQMWMAVFADVGVMVLAVLNSMRNLITRQPKSVVS